MVQQQGSLTAALHSIPAEDPEQGEGGEREQLREEEIRTVAVGYELEDEMEKTDEDSVLSHSSNDPAPLGAQHPALSEQDQSELFDPQTLQTVVADCEIPEQRTALEGSQVSESKNRRYYCIKTFYNHCFFLLVNYHHWSQLRGFGIRRNPAQHGQWKCGGNHLHRRRRGRLQPGVHIGVKSQRGTG